MFEYVDSPLTWTNFGDNPELLRLVYDADPALIFVKDRQGRFVFANKALADIYGTTVEDLLGKTDADFNPSMAEIEHFLTDDLYVMDRREELFIAEESVTDDSGNIVWLQTIKRPIIDACDVCNHVLGVSFDITARKQAELRERELQLRLARSQRMESLGVMAGGIAHDLNNILGPLVAYPELIRSKIGGDPAAGQLLTDMAQATSRAAAVIQDLLTPARRGSYHLGPISVNDVVREFLQSPCCRRLQSGQPEVLVTTSLAQDLPLALGSSPHYYQVVMNLVTNAFEAMSGPGQLTVATRCEKRAAESAGFFCGIPAADPVAANYVMLEVADTGEGIPADRLGSIFEPFVSSKVLGRSGSGLGLSVVYGVLQDMNGHVDVQSEPGAGTRFLVGLPACHAGGAAQASAEDGDLAGTGTVLIIDDLASQRMLGARVLGALGYSVLTAGHCAEALRILSESAQVDLVLIDMLLQDHPDGLDTFRAIQAVRPGLPCIIVSGYAESDRIHSACAEGAFGLVKKPYTQQSLGMAIRRALGAGRGG